MSILGYAAKGPRGKLERFDYEPLPLGPYDVEISITHCGICRSDLHLIDDDWSVSEYPLIPGHEIIGEVSELGSEVRGLEKGMQVGVGWQRQACYQCDQCLAGDDNLCPNQEATCVGHHGGFADAIRLDSRFVFVLPEQLKPETTAPLLCGGITVYSPLTRHCVRPAMRVGVVGIGGLGHLALQFAHAFGCEVTAFSTTPEKESDARFFGADHFVLSTDEAQLEAITGTLDLVLSTVHVDLDWQQYLNTLRPRGTLCFVGAGQGPINIPPFALITGARSLSGSPTGSRSAIREMLDFAARHDIEARAEIRPMAEVNEALERVRSGQVRYRMVLRN
jgi:uncharacterized zinc-type alcohol dehydrogenase-like protein